MRRWHQLRNCVFGIFFVTFPISLSEAKLGKIGFESENIAVHCEIWELRATKFRSPLRNVWHFWPNSELTPEKTFYVVDSKAIYRTRKQ
jgi:hypothetical protein